MDQDNNDQDHIDQDNIDQDNIDQDDNFDQDRNRHLRTERQAAPATPDVVADHVMAGSVTAGSAERRRGGAVAGVATGLAVGAAIGLFAVSPTFTSAATDVTPPTTADEETSDDSAPPAAGERIRESLETLVDDGTITAEQADAVAEHLAAQRLEHRDLDGNRPGRAMRPGFDGEVVAELIGIDAEQLREALRNGSSIAEVAEANGVDPQIVIDALVEEASAHLDVAIENGRLTEDEAAEKLAGLEERITDRVNGEHPRRP